MPINIYELADAFRNIENDFDEHRYVDKRQGKILEFSRYADDLGEECDEEEDVFDNENIVPFPGKYEFRAYDVMEEFAQIQPDISKCNQLIRQIGGRGTFRRFRETASRLGLLQEWYDYENKAWLDFTIKWCNMNDVDFEPKPQEFSYRSAGLDDLKPLADMLCKLYYKTKRQIKEHRAGLLEDIPAQLADETQAMFLAHDEDKPVGVAHVSLRSQRSKSAEGSPSGYLEAVFVELDYRRKGIGSNLVYECRKWAVRRDCSEIASDSELDNADSYKFHMSIGFQEVSRKVHFTSELTYTRIEMNVENENNKNEVN